MFVKILETSSRVSSDSVEVNFTKFMNGVFTNFEIIALKVKILKY